jgi:hypothetical protein
LIEVIRRPRVVCGGWAGAVKAFNPTEKAAVTGLKTSVLELGSAELTSSGGLLLKHLLLVRIGVSDLDDVLVATFTADGSVVELLDDLLADIATLEANERS